jgi:hypothetical protein
MSQGSGMYPFSRMLPFFSSSFSGLNPGYRRISRIHIQRTADWNFHISSIFVMSDFRFLTHVAASLLISETIVAIRFLRYNSFGTSASPMANVVAKLKSKSEEKRRRYVPYFK